tara:strand:- start:396 stop:614 length:219 start_codon:yes stop_codon:yes gene_type:complete
MKVKTALLRIEDIAKEYNVSQKSIRRTIHSGALESNKVGGVHFIQPNVSAKFLETTLAKAIGLAIRKAIEVL